MESRAPDAGAGFGKGKWWNPVMEAASCHLQAAPQQNHLPAGASGPDRDSWLGGLRP